jgi:hypothetical protein
VIDVISGDLELGVLIDLLLICEEVPARGGIGCLGLGASDLVDTPDLVVTTASLARCRHVDEVADAEEGPEIVELDAVGGRALEAVVKRKDFLVDKVNVASHVTKRLGAVHQIVVIFVGVGVNRLNA